MWECGWEWEHDQPGRAKLVKEGVYETLRVKMSPENRKRKSKVETRKSPMSTSYKGTKLKYAVIHGLNLMPTYH